MNNKHVNFKTKLDLQIKFKSADTGLVLQRVDCNSVNYCSICQGFRAVENSNKLIGVRVDSYYTGIQRGFPKFNSVKNLSNLDVFLPKYYEVIGKPNLMPQDTTWIITLNSFFMANDLEIIAHVYYCKIA